MALCRNRVSLQFFVISDKVSARNPVSLPVFVVSSKSLDQKPGFFTRIVISDKVSARNPVSSAIFVVYHKSLGQKPGFWNRIKPIWETVDSIVLLAHRHKLLLISEILARLDRLIVTQWEDLFHHNHRGYSYPVNLLN